MATPARARSIQSLLFFPIFCVCNPYVRINLGGGEGAGEEGRRGGASP